MKENLIITELLDAIVFALGKHKKQKRKNSKLPYVIHPVRVAKMLSELELPEEIDINTLLKAAILHDVLEDTQTENSEIEKRFGKEVLSIVLEVTKSKNLNSEEAQKELLSRCDNFSISAKILKLADRLDNLKDLDNLNINFKKEYLKKCEEILSKLLGTNEKLEKEMEDYISKKQCGQV